ncbi:hypothetical protein Bbelb_363450 [Branchiostoma belcheri]|nr:hypothetical protein Bbelb_363450 [Branchiostoma belcheri]
MANAQGMIDVKCSSFPLTPLRGRVGYKCGGDWMIEDKTRCAEDELCSARCREWLSSSLTKLCAYILRNPSGYNADQVHVLRAARVVRCYSPELKNSPSCSTYQPFTSRVMPPILEQIAMVPIS